MKRYIAATIAALALTVGVAAAAVTFDQATGTGSAGKEDVQAALGLSDAQLDRSASAVQFRVFSLTTGDIVWECGYFDSSSGELVRTLDRDEAFRGTSAQRVGDSVTRAGGAVTGFELTGYVGEPKTTAHWSGPKPGTPGFGSCPAGWQLIQGPSAHVGTSTSLQVSRNGGRWVDLLALES
jgi:hypothetical protein